MNQKLDLLLKGQGEIKHQLESIEEQLSQITAKIEGYQSLVKRQMEIASSDEEKEHIIHAFSQECIDKIMQTADMKHNQQQVEIEKRKLMCSFGSSAWNKMDASSQTFLVSAKVMFNQLIGITDIIDYSGICLLVTKALEVEMSKRFYRWYKGFIQSNYDDESEYPTTLMNHNNKLLDYKQFTLGSVPYVLGYKKQRKLTKKQIDNNESKLKEYAEKELFSTNTDVDVLKVLKQYGEKVEDIKERFRNPSAHTNEISRTSAKECLEIVVDVEKLMKNMLDSFDK